MHVRPQGAWAPAKQQGAAETKPLVDSQSTGQKSITMQCI